jgi:hypothetical protein
MVDWRGVINALLKVDIPPAVEPARAAAVPTYPTAPPPSAATVGEKAIVTELQRLRNVSTTAAMSSAALLKRPDFSASNDSLFLLDRDMRRYMVMEQVLTRKVIAAPTPGTSNIFSIDSRIASTSDPNVQPTKGQVWAFGSVMFLINPAPGGITDGYFTFGAPDRILGAYPYLNGAALTLQYPIVVKDGTYLELKVVRTGGAAASVHAYVGLMRLSEVDW